jgi:hypothetical protein
MFRDKPVSGLISQLDASIRYASYFENSWAEGEDLRKRPQFLSRNGQNVTSLAVFGSSFQSYVEVGLLVLLLRIIGVKQRSLTSCMKPGVAQNRR